MIRLKRPDCPNPDRLRVNYKTPENKAALQNSSFGKCMYCESKVSHISFGDVEHIRPKSKYEHLEFEWSNLGYVCQKCNNAKRDFYDERAPLINPYDEDPQEHLLAGGSVILPKYGNQRGKATIDTIELNRHALVEQRREALESISRILQLINKLPNDVDKIDMLESIDRVFDDSTEYAFVRRALVILFRTFKIQPQE